MSKAQQTFDKYGSKMSKTLSDVVRKSNRFGRSYRDKDGTMVYVIPKWLRTKTSPKFVIKSKGPGGGVKMPDPSGGKKSKFTDPGFKIKVKYE